MSTHVRAPVSTALAIAVGLVVLLGYFVNIDLLESLRRILVHWAVVLAAVTLWVGVANLFSVHWRKASTGQAGGFYSLVLILSLVVTVAVVGFFGPAAPASLWIFNNIQMPIESTLMAVLAVTLVYASARLMRRRLNAFSLVFLATALIVLLGTVPLLGMEIPGLHGTQGLRALITRIPAVAGARGLLLGVALGTIATSLRVMFGADQFRGGPNG